ncbi:MAG: TIGR03936 family radical SAM-associated protein [Actinomycetota bacterium]|nr:TIGR03936 family radical SAM-associated protein [Actinomycetota bacterium]
MRIRFRYAKLGKVRFTSQRDVARMWERALRRAALPVAYSAGFSPRPLLSFGLALPTGAESLAEFVDIVLDEGRVEPDEVVPHALVGRLAPFLPDGVTVRAAALVDGGSLQHEVTACGWELLVDGARCAAVAEAVASLLAASSVPLVRERKGRQAEDDLRPAIRELSLVGGAEDERVVVVAEVATQPRGVRPAELVRALAEQTVDVAGLALAGACRTAQWIERDGQRWEPLDDEGRTAGSVSAGAARERAS